MLTVALTIRTMLAALLLQGSSGATVDPDAYYRLTTQFQGHCKSLDIVNDATDDKPRLRDSDEVSGQLWKFTPVGDGYYRLTTQWQGKDYSLDIINDDKDNTPVLAETANVSGQHWKLSSAGNGYHRLTTRWKGTGRSLDIVNDSRDDRPILAKTANVSGQFWMLTKESDVGPVPKRLGLDKFYKKHLDADGIPIIGSDEVDDAAFYRARYTIREALSRVPAVRAKMIELDIKIAIMANCEVTTDHPEYKAKMPNPHDGRDIDTVRGYGASPLIPVQLAAEENLLCTKSKQPGMCVTDSYPTEDIFLHEFAHSMHWAMSELYGKKFDTELEGYYLAAKAKAKKAGDDKKYAMTNVQEYFAEGVQTWFNLNAQNNAEHNHVNTRAELKSHDPDLYDFLARYFPENQNNCSCHRQGG